jgi:hypothetical protein
MHEAVPEKNASQFVDKRRDEFQDLDKRACSSSSRESDTATCERSIVPMRWSGRSARTYGSCGDRQTFFREEREEHTELIACRREYGEVEERGGEGGRRRREEEEKGRRAGV